MYCMVILASNVNISFNIIVYPCDSSPCKNGATCKNVEDKFMCNCTKGYTGVSCDQKGKQKRIF